MSNNVIGYGLRYKDRSYWIGIWNERDTAEDVKGKTGKGLEVVALVDAEHPAAQNPDDGPAFPMPDSVFQPDDSSLRAYFAAHAPAEIPEWFEAEPTRDRPKIPHWNTLPEHLQDKARDWLEDSCYDFDKQEDEPALYYFQKEVEAIRREIVIWEREQVEARYFLWRWYYADMMLAISEEDTE